MPSLFQRSIRCGSTNCRCVKPKSEGGKLHGPYWYFEYYKKGSNKPTMKYVGKDLKAPDGSFLNDRDEALAIWSQCFSDKMNDKTQDKVHDKITPQEFEELYKLSDSTNEIEKLLLEKGFSKDFIKSLNSDIDRPRIKQIMRALLSCINE